MKYPRLKPDTIPSQFPNCPQYMSKNTLKRKSRDEKLSIIDEQNFIKPLDVSNREYSLYQKAVCFQNYDEFLTLLNTLHLPDGWFTIIDKEKVTICKFVYTPGPVVTYAIVINKELEITRGKR